LQGPYALFIQHKDLSIPYALSILHKDLSIMLF